MRKYNRRLLFLVCALVSFFFCVTPVAMGHWDESMPYKWLQMPDLSEWGMDVDATTAGQWPPQVLGDDFLCTVTGPITGIHIWGSWYHDELPQNPMNVVFTLTLRADIPGTTGSPSMPGALLWSRQFQPGEFEAEIYFSGQEGYYSPCLPYYEVIGDTMCFLYNFHLPEGEVMQYGSPTEPVVYWLEIQAQPMTTGARFGWKTSVTHWNDDAVWVVGSEPLMPPIPWNELRYPTGHPQAGASIDLAFVITGEALPRELEFGDAPEGGIAYPSTAVIGQFPTCKTVGPAGWIEHNNFGAWFGPGFEFETDGDAGLCATGAFPPYDADECFNDGDAGLMFPQAYTIDGLNNVVTCPQSTGTALGKVCQMAIWGQDIDIRVHNTMPNESIGYVNVLMDWDQNGAWAGAASCPTAAAPEHVLVNFQVPNPYDGSLSALMPIGTGFLIGPNHGYVWTRFSITEQPVPVDWNGEGSFEDGETEDYLLRVDAQPADEFDFGDAPDTYITKLPNGAQHLIVPRIYLGSLIDAEADGQPTIDAMGDDNAGVDDEDGVVWTSALVPGQMATVDVNANAVGFLDAWVDFDGDGTWTQADNQIFGSTPLGIGVNSLNFTVPPTAATGATFARFRFSTIGGLLPIGLASDGEVEDYQVAIKEGPKPPTPNLKWSQPPIEIDPLVGEPIYCGWDQPSWTNEPVSRWQIVADDFRCLGTMPITSIHWWGSYVGWEGLEPPQPEPVTWRIGFWSNVPAVPGMPQDYSYPERLLWQFDVPASRVEREWVGFDQHPQFPPDTCFQYYVKLTKAETFWQRDFINNTQQEVFWVSIVAIYPGPMPIPFPWGWKTRPWHWMDDAVRFELTTAPQPGMILDPAMITPIEDPLTQQSVDVAFELDTDPNYIKWEQPFTGIRNWPHYEDEESMGFEDQSGAIVINRLVADDWPCRGKTPITSIVWWGSYIDYWFEACQPQTAQPVKPDYFLLQIWTDVPVGPLPFSHPGEKIWEYRVANYDEVLVGADKHPEGYTGPHEAVFRYSARLPKTAWFMQTELSAIYWLSVVAVYKPNNTPTYHWGWTNHPHVFQDDAAAWEMEPGGMWHWVPLEDETLNTEDMSFILFTDPDCLAHSAPEYARWVSYGKPSCWCYRKQCRGDINGKSDFLGRPVVLADLTIFKTVYGKTLAEVLAIPGGICGDLNHNSDFSGKPVVLADLTIFKTYYGLAGALVPDCDQAPVITGPYNYWMAP
jgi:hypothetical protein